MTKKKQYRILISRPDRVGDVVLSTPIPREIKKTFPNAFVAVLVRNYTKDIYLNNPYVDEIITADEFLSDSKKNFFKWIKQIRKFKFTHALMLLPNERINYLLFLSGIKTRVGVGHKFYQFITGTKSVNRNKYIPLRHEADYCMDLARKIGVETNDLTTEIHLSSAEKNHSEKIKKELMGDKKYLVGVHSTSGNSAPNWTTNEYKKLIKQLKQNRFFQVVITDNIVPPELNGIDGLYYPNVDSSLRESIINFNALDLLISASTGPMHICSALKVKTVSLFCPLTACSPKLWGPLGNESTVILPTEGYCQTKCPGDPKKCTFTGDGGIEVNRVALEAEKMLAH